MKVISSVTANRCSETIPNSTMGHLAACALACDASDFHLLHWSPQDMHQIITPKINLYQEGGMLFQIIHSYTKHKWKMISPTPSRKMQMPLKPYTFDHIRDCAICESVYVTASFGQFIMTFSSYNARKAVRLASYSELRCNYKHRIYLQCLELVTYEQILDV